MFLKSGDINAAQAEYNKAIQLDSSYPAAHLENGLWYVKNKVLSQGLMELQRYLELVGKDVEGTDKVMVLVEQLQQAMGKNTEAEQPASGGSKS
jgi:hypothetical protein